MVRARSFNMMAVRCRTTGAQLDAYPALAELMRFWRTSKGRKRRNPEECGPERIMQAYTVIRILPTARPGPMDRIIGDLNMLINNSSTLYSNESPYLQAISIASRVERIANHDNGCTGLHGHARPLCARKACSHPVVLGRNVLFFDLVVASCSKDIPLIGRRCLHSFSLRHKQNSGFPVT